LGKGLLFHTKVWLVDTPCVIHAKDGSLKEMINFTGQRRNHAKALPDNPAHC